MSEATGTAERAGGRSPRAVRVARWALFGLLLVSAAVTLFGLPELQRAVAEGRWPRATLAAPAALLGLFVVGYAAYRIMLVRAGRYPAGKALVRIALVAAVVGAVVGLVITPPEARGPGRTAVDLSRPLSAADPEVRALAAEIARHRDRDEALRHVDRLIDLLEDPAPEVRRQARLTLVALAGRDAGGEGAAAVERWRAYWQESRPETDR